MKPRVLTVAGSDSSGGAGLQADVRTLSACEVHPLTVVTAVTAQSAAGVAGWSPVPPATVASQLEAVFADGAPAAIKSGMLAEATSAVALARCLLVHPAIPYVCDPLVLSGTGVALIGDETLATLRRELLPRADLLTPNLDELALLAGREDLRDEAERIAAAEELVRQGAGAVLIKGGHRRRRGVDLLVAPGGVREFAGETVPCGRVHGAGCVLASAIAAGLARGEALVAAVDAARRFVGRAIAAGPTWSGVRYPDPQFAALTGETP